MSYSGIVTVILEPETLSGMDDETRKELAGAADAYENASPRLRAAIIRAARKGETPAVITRAIMHVMTYDYVAKLIREDRAGNPEEYPGQS
jgi:hypothetical protein